MELTRLKIESCDPIFFTGTRARSRVSRNDQLFPCGSEFGPNSEIPASPLDLLMYCCSRDNKGIWICLSCCCFCRVGVIIIFHMRISPSVLLSAVSSFFASSLLVCVWGLFVLLVLFLAMHVRWSCKLRSKSARNKKICNKNASKWRVFLIIYPKVTGRLCVDFPWNVISNLPICLTEIVSTACVSGKWASTWNAILA